MDNNFKDWREILEVMAQGERAMTKIEIAKNILMSLKYDCDKVKALKAVFGMKAEEEDE